MIVSLADSQILGRNQSKPSQATANPSPKLSYTNPLNNLVRESETVLMRFPTVFPFDLFTDEIVIDGNKVNIITKTFFSTYHVRSILIGDISDVSVDTGLFLATLNIIDSSNYRFPIEVKVRALTKENAFLARKTIQGLISTKRKNIDLSTLPSSEVKKNIISIGHTQGKSIRNI